MGIDDGGGKYEIERIRRRLFTLLPLCAFREATRLSVSVGTPNPLIREKVRCVRMERTLVAYIYLCESLFPAAQTAHLTSLYRLGPGTINSGITD